MYRDYLWTCNFCIDQDKIWFVPYWYNLLCCYDLKEKKYDKVVKIPEKNEFPGLYNDLLLVNDKLILVPSDAKKICIYDKATEQFEAYELLFTPCMIDKLSAAIEVKGNVYFLPCCYKHIVKMELDSKQISYLPLPEMESTVWNPQVCATREEIYLLGEKNEILVFHTQTEKIEVVCLENNDETFAVVSSYKGDFVLIDKKGQVHIYSKNGKKKNIIANQIIGFHCEEGESFFSSILCGNKIFFLPCKANMIIELDCEEGIIKEAKFSEELMKKDRRYFWWGQAFSSAKMWGDKILFEGIEHSKLFAVSHTTGEVQEYDLLYNCIQEEYLREISREYQNGFMRIMVEHDVLYLRLENYIKNICNLNDTTKQDGCAGVKIYSVCK